MSTRWTSADLAGVRHRLYGQSTRPSRKYRNEPITVAGIHFASKLEAERFDQLRLFQQAGEVSWFIRQPRFDLAPGVQYVADFLVVWMDGRVQIDDVKGMETPAFRMKRKLMAERYPNVTITILTKAAF